MKKQGKRIIGIMLALVLALTCVPVTNAKATTIAEMATQTIKLNEFDTITFNADVPIVVKVVLKTKGTFAFIFKPYDPGFVNVELYDMQSNLLAQDEVGTSYENITPYNIGYKGDLDAGTYYLRMYNVSTRCNGTYSFNAQMYPCRECRYPDLPKHKDRKNITINSGIYQLQR